jgi:hypothetical protein
MDHTFENYIAAQVSDKVDTKCWIWNGTFTRKGYGRKGSGAKYKSMHQWQWEDKFGAVPEGLVLDHLCGVRICCNPDHLEAITNEENIRRGRAGRNNPYRDKCKRGHPRGDNSYWTKKDGKDYPICITCQKERYARKKVDPEFIAKLKSPEHRAKVAGYQRIRRADPAYRALCNERSRISKEKKKQRQQPEQ